MNYCKNCKHAEIVMGYLDKLDYSLCHHPNLQPKVIISLVTGKIDKGYVPYCSTQRMESGGCGLPGKLFEPTEAYKEFERDCKIEAAEERRRDREEERAEFDFERDCGARP